MIQSKEEISKRIKTQTMNINNQNVHLQALKDYAEAVEKITELVRDNKEMADLRRENGYLEALRLSDKMEIDGLKAAIKDGKSAAKIRDLASTVGSIHGLLDGVLEVKGLAKLNENGEWEVEGVDVA